MEKNTPTLFTEFKGKDLIQTSLLLDNNIGKDAIINETRLSKELLEKLPKLPTLNFYQA